MRRLNKKYEAECASEIKHDAECEAEKNQIWLDMRLN